MNIIDLALLGVLAFALIDGTIGLFEVINAKIRGQIAAVESAVSAALAASQCTGYPIIGCRLSRCARDVNRDVRQGCANALRPDWSQRFVGSAHQWQSIDV